MEKKVDILSFEDLIRKRCAKGPFFDMERSKMNNDDTRGECVCCVAVNRQQKNNVKKTKHS